MNSAMEKTSTHPTAQIGKNVSRGKNTKVWHYAQIRENVVIGENCIIGKNVYIDHDSVIGSNVKIQNNCSLYFKCVIDDGVFIGPHVILTNDKQPRAVTPDGKLKNAADWHAATTHIKTGASLGAGAIILPGITVGEFAMIGAGAVVTKEVAPYTMVYGNPAIFRGYVCKCGQKIENIIEHSQKLILHCTHCNQEIPLTK